MTKNKKENRKIREETIRLARIYPDIYGEVLEEMGLDVEEWRRFRQFMDRYPSREKKQNGPRKGRKR